MKEHAEDLSRLIVSADLLSVLQGLKVLFQTLENGKPFAEAKVCHTGLCIALRYSPIDV